MVHTDFTGANFKASVIISTSEGIGMSYGIFLILLIQIAKKEFYDLARGA